MVVVLTVCARAGVLAVPQLNANTAREGILPLFAKLTPRVQNRRESLAQPSGGSTTGLNPDAPSYTPSTTTSALCSDQRKPVLLQTARNLVEVRLLLDSGSQKSYLTERARELLGIEPTGDQLLSIATFGSRKE